MVVLELCKKIGIKDFWGLKRFLQEERQGNESVSDCLMRYYLSLGGTKFKIRG
ncbi:MAG: hypothetical protein IJZ29_04350 [Clostridia bacterium]|nr:hypothetical protein [Clostridia bacterium]